MILKLICSLFLAFLCFCIDKELKKATENKDLHDQIRWGVYLIIGIIVLTSTTT